MYYNIKMQGARPEHNVAFIQAITKRHALKKYTNWHSGKFHRENGILYFQPKSSTGNPAPLLYAEKAKLTHKDRQMMHFIDSI